MPFGRVCSMAGSVTGSVRTQVSCALTRTLVHTHTHIRTPTPTCLLSYCLLYVFWFAQKDQIPLFGPEIPASSDHGPMRELYENRYKLLKDDNQMLRENLRREQQVKYLNTFLVRLVLGLSRAYESFAVSKFESNSRSASLLTCSDKIPCVGCLEMHKNVVLEVYQ